MSYSQAATYAKEAVAKAQSARMNSDETYERRMAQATEALAKAVQELAEQLHRDS